MEEWIKEGQAKMREEKKKQEQVERTSEQDDEVKIEL
jgi:hypothetical protein